EPGCARGGFEKFVEAADVEQTARGWRWVRATALPCASADDAAWRMAMRVVESMKSTPLKSIVRSVVADASASGPWILPGRCRRRRGATGVQSTGRPPARPA